VQNCAWTSVIREILRLTTLFPYLITSGLCLLTELLPIPLPLTVRQVEYVHFKNLSIVSYEISDTFSEYSNGLD
jgi:hypothetical protein